MLIGYARVSTAVQNRAMQLDALKRAGCKRIFEDTASGARSDRPEWARLMDTVRKGDVIVVWKLDRAGRSLRHLIDVANDLSARGVGLRSLHENLDTSSSSGKLVFHVFGALAEFERDIIRERSKAGLEAARARGRVGGRRFSLTEEQTKQLRALYARRELSIAAICATFKISRPSLYNYLRDRPRPGDPESTAKAKTVRKMPTTKRAAAKGKR